MSEKLNISRIWAVRMDETHDYGTFCAPRPHMNGGPPNADAVAYVPEDIYDAAIARAAKADSERDAMKALVRVNFLRHGICESHEEIDAHINAALTLPEGVTR